MRKRIVSSICSMVMILGLILCAGVDAGASDSRPMVDGSYLTQDMESIGTATPVTRGANLETGYSKLRRVADGVIYAGGTTIASHICESVKVAVLVERTLSADDEWEYVDSWIHENQNANVASTSKRIEVEGGWYYRVNCYHTADGDIMESSTDGLYVPEY